MRGGKVTNLGELISGTQDSLEIEFKGGRKGLFSNPRNIPFRVGDHAVVDIDRGKDIGVVIRDGDEVSSKTVEQGVRGPILRRATSADLELLAELREKEAEAHRICQQSIARQDLPMKLVDVEWQFDGNKIRFYFTSDHRVDFRKLVRDLAATFKTRIEMRQIGVRDEARRLGGYGRCGRYYCCRGVIQDFDPVTLKMVKEQHLAPGSPKISGGCGRLMCCLRYERGFYADASREYPKVGAKVTLQGGGLGRVVGVDIFHRQVTVADNEGKSVSVSIEDYKAGGITTGGDADIGERRRIFVVDRGPDTAAGGSPGAGEASGRERGHAPTDDRGRGADDRRKARSSPETRGEDTASSADAAEQSEPAEERRESAPSSRGQAPAGGGREGTRQPRDTRAGGRDQTTQPRDTRAGGRDQTTQPGDARAGDASGQQGKSESKKRRGRRSGGSRRRGSRRGRSGNSRKGSNGK